PLEGKVDATVNLTGRGARWTQVAPTLNGGGTVSFEDGNLTTADIGPHLPAGPTPGLQAQGHTHLGKASTAFQGQRGWIQLQKPLACDSPYGAVRLGGRIGLTKELDLKGRVSLKPSIVSKPLGLFRLRAPTVVQVPIAVRGTLENPSVSTRAPGIQGRRLIP